MYFIFLLCLVANSTALRQPVGFVYSKDRQLEYKVAYTYMENIGNWMLLLPKSIERMCWENNVKESDVAKLIKEKYREHFQEIDKYSGLHILSSYIERMGSSLRENDNVAKQAILHFDGEWAALDEDRRKEVKKYFREITDYGSKRLDKAIANRIMRFLPDSNNRIKREGFLDTITTKLRDGYKNLIADPLYTPNRSTRVIIIHTIITLSNIRENPDIKLQDYEKITTLFNELMSLPFVTDDQKKIVDLKTIELLDVVDNVWKKLNGERVPPFTKGKVNYTSDVGKAWKLEVDSMNCLWETTRGGAHPPCEDIVREHFGDKLKGSSPDINWLRGLKTGDRGEKFKEEGRMYYFLDSLLSSTIWKPRILENSQP